ncbi:replication-relaxation family protein [Streptomyces sp. NPDC001401]|uniref:replication-relaxation family protein n=1 Tax=Streptomyces sp. NPDC001401 TaxID=3364570 RepID=UPI0036A928D2
MIYNSVPPHTQRTYRPKRVSLRAAATSDYLARLAPRLTSRDRWLIRMLYEHRVFTSSQITDLAWPSVRAANHRLHQLYVWRVVDRFKPFVSYGSAPMHYVLDLAGATVLAHEECLDLRSLGYRHERAMSIAHSLLLAHAVGTNGFFTDLLALSRQADTPGHLAAWWSEARCRRHFGDVVCPDGYGRWQAPDGEFEWFLEYDRGTERPAKRVGDKLPRYAKLAENTGIITPVLVWTPTLRRETAVRHALDQALAALPDRATVPVAVTHAELTADGDALSACWLPLTASSAHRLPLSALSSAWPQLPPLPATPDEPASRSGTTSLLPPPIPQCPKAGSDHGWW